MQIWTEAIESPILSWPLNSMAGWWFHVWNGTFLGPKFGLSHRLLSKWFYVSALQNRERGGPWCYECGEDGWRYWKRQSFPIGHTNRCIRWAFQCTVWVGKAFLDLSGLCNVRDCMFLMLPKYGWHSKAPTGVHSGSCFAQKAGTTSFKGKPSVTANCSLAEVRGRMALPSGSVFGITPYARLRTKLYMYRHVQWTSSLNTRPWPQGKMGMQGPSFGQRWGQNAGPMRAGL